MDYKVLPRCFSSGMDPFRSLPPEMVSYIFRKLDIESLLNVYMTCLRFKKICLNDPILRRRLKSGIADIRYNDRKTIIIPCHGMNITRNQLPSSSFRPNIRSCDKKCRLETKIRRKYDMTIMKTRSSNKRSLSKMTNPQSMRL